MYINTSSWHYKLLDFLDFYSATHGSPSLCRYFWMVVVACICAGIISVVALFAIIFLFVPPYLYTLAFLYGFEPLHMLFVKEPVNPLDGLLAAFFIMGHVLYAVLLIAGFFYAWTEWDLGDRFRDRFQAIEEDTSPGLLISWLRAKKEKVCPTITFVRDENLD